MRSRIFLLSLWLASSTLASKQTDMSQWQNWTEWTTCSNSCGTGIQTRGRQCEGDDCVGSRTEERTCVDQSNCAAVMTESESPCSATCFDFERCSMWTTWSEWSQCLVAGAVNQRRERWCIGNNCEGSKTEEKSCEQAILITGGSNALTSVEVIHLNGSNYCTLPDLPDERFRHTQNMMTLCGGGYYTNTRDNCLTLTNGEWIKSHQLKYAREDHTSWSRGDEIILMGGWFDSGTTSEVLTQYNSVATEGFKLQHKTKYACSITPDYDTLIMTGGSSTMNTVSLYNRRGWVKNLDSLSTGRRSHACGHYRNNDGDTVYLVTGGWDGGRNRFSSTEILPSLTSQWITLQGASLPRAMSSVKALSLTGDNSIILTGGYHGSYSNSVLKFDATTETWLPVGHLSKERNYQAMSFVNINQVKNYCV